MEDELRFDKKEANTKTRRSSAKSSQRKASRAGGGGITNTSHCVTSVTESDYCDMATMASARGDQFTQAGEDMASLISFGSLPSSSGGSADHHNGLQRQPRDLGDSGDLALLLRSGLSDEDILATLVTWTMDPGPGLGARYRLGCLPYLVNLLHLHPLHTEAARPTRHIRRVFTVTQQL